ncbi:filamentous hemagglutinin N-terminal domain-containing protein, partial [Roseateles sp.]|uniref:two-partner secretion domain-containing protein n=1 Tax=Roseateles sp. TaxID=1971397 RepID=UPI003BA6D1D7
MNEHASINRLYRLVWNECSGTWVAVSELSRGRGKRSIAGASGFGALIAVLRSLPALLALGFGCAQAAPPANTLPQGGQVVAGQAVIGSSGARLDVTQSSQRAAIDWQSFNLGANAQVNFKQPNSASVTLNRVLDAQPSQIFGRITSNGQVFLSNPAGIYFSPSSSANVGALVATTHSISTADFMAGKTGFARNGATGSVVNQGQLTADLGGYIALLAPEVRNEGVILAQAGTVALAAGEMIALQLNGSSLLNLLVEPATVAALVDNQQAVLAPGGQIILSAQAISSLQSGVIRNSGQLAADRFAEVDGRIRLEASQAIVQTGSVQGRELSARSKNLIEAGRWDASASLPGQSGGNIDIQASGHIEQTTASSLIADGQHGGSVRLSAGSDAWVSGSLSAQGRSSQGGEIALTAPTLTVAGASLDASGEQGGGRVRIGGGWQGKDADLANADSTRVSASTVNVSARAAGQGGTAVLWSERLTQLGGGQILAKGGELNGDGGRVEVSSHGQLGFGGKVDASARHGAKGELLLDPKNIEIVASASEALNILSLADANPTDDGQFGEQIAELSNNGVSTNRVLANKPGDSTVASNAGAVRLYNSLTGALISTLTGSQADDQVGWSGVTALSNGNYVVRSPNWSNGSNAYAGAVTWGNGSTGISGAVSSSNSLVGSQAGDNVGATDITKLSNGNYVVRSPNWSNGSNAYAGAVTWGNGSTGISGAVSSSNSLVGSQAGDNVGATDITKLSNGNYVVSSPNWKNGSNANAGAVTWGSGSAGVSGVVSSINS